MACVGRSQYRRPSPGAGSKGVQTLQHVGSFLTLSYFIFIIEKKNLKHEAFNDLVMLANGQLVCYKSP